MFPLPNKWLLLLHMEHAALTLLVEYCAPQVLNETTQESHNILCPFLQNSPQPHSEISLVYTSNAKEMNCNR